MFWDSVQQGLSVLLHWQTYVAMIEFLALMILPQLAIGAAMMRKPSIAAAGCLIPILMTFVQLLALVVFVLTLAPLIFGRADGAAWSFPWVFISESPWTFLRLMLASGFIGLVLSLLKLDLFANAIMGCVVLAFVALNIANQAGATAYLWPGFWFFLGILVISTVLRYVGLMLAAGLVMLLSEEHRDSGQVVAAPISTLLMFLPVFIYGGWLVQQMHY